MGGGGAFVPERIKRVLESETMDTFVEPEDAPAPWEPISQKFNPHTPFDAPPGSKRTFSIVARRPLATPVIGSAAALSDWNHLQFIADDGTNIGLFKEEGYSADRKDQWDKYAQTNYVKYDADIMEEAMRIHMRDNKGREYNLRQYNCIDYVNEVLEIAEKIASEKDLPLKQNFMR